MFVKKYETKKNIPYPQLKCVTLYGIRNPQKQKLKRKKHETLPSIIGLASRICCSIHECCPLIAARYCKINLVDSVFPAPDSPLSEKEED